MIAPDDPDRGFVRRAAAYARRVAAREEVAGELERRACARFLRDLERQQTDGFPWVMSTAHAGRACRFIELLRHIKGKWARPTIVDGQLVHPQIVLEYWQVFVVVNLFGWVHPQTLLRRFRKAYLEVARKNAKSALAAAILLYVFCT